MARTVYKMSKYVRDTAFARAKALVDDFLESHDKRPMAGGACLWWAYFGIKAIKSVNPSVRAIVQAGSASFRRVPVELDDGVSSTHFSYVYTPGARPPRPECLPEMHVWIALPDMGEIVDFSTGRLAELCEKTCGDKWLSPPPPDYVWANANSTPDGFVYIPNIYAISLVVELLASHAPGG